jgi:hypothetical protein
MSVFESGEGKEWFETAFADEFLYSNNENSGGSYSNTLISGRTHILYQYTASKPL